MWHKLTYSILVLGLGWLFGGQALQGALAEDNYVGVITVDGAIDPISARYLARGIERATAERAKLVVVKLDTPGGLLSSTRKMVESILGAGIPVAVYVAPPGAQAASAGTFITAAANFAAMAPGTNIGAASPVAGGGRDLPSTLAKKINEDTRAFIRSIAKQRGRNAQALEETVTKARSYSSDEAVETKVVDFMASDLTALLAHLEGRTAKTAAGEVVLRTKGSSIRQIDQTALERFLSVMANPDLAFVLLVIGGLGIWTEFVTPGFIGPGVVGGIALALAFVGMGHLPVNWIAVGLIVFAMALFFLEAQQPGLGIFLLGGLICFVLGAFLLFGDVFRTPDIPEPSYRVNLWVIGVTTGLITVGAGFFLYTARAIGGSQTGYASGSEDTLVGRRGVVVSDLTPSGTIRLGDQEWTATTDSGELIREGEEVRVLGVYGGILKVSQSYSLQGENAGRNPPT